MEKVTVDKDITLVGQYTFAGTSPATAPKFTSITFNGTLTDGIDQRAFDNQHSLTKIVITQSTLFAVSSHTFVDLNPAGGKIIVPCDVNPATA